MPVAEGMTSTEADATRRTGSREIVMSVGCAILGFLVTATLLHAAIRNPLSLHAAIRSEKLAMLKDWHGKVFSAAFGSSHVHDGFDPRVFDATLAGTPVATRSGNLAVEGGSQTEQFVMAQQFLKQLESPAQAGAPSQPCLVMLEISAGANFANDHLVDARAIDIYDWPTTDLVRHYIDPTMRSTQRYGRLGFAGIAMSMHYMSVGMLSSKIFAPPLDQELIANQSADDRRGQDVLPYHPTSLPSINEMVHSSPKTPAIVPQPKLEGNDEMVRRLAALSPVAHVSFVYVAMPQISNLGEIEEYPDSITVSGPRGALEVPIINLGRPDRYPALFNPEIWYDRSHLTGTGAEMATRILADELKQWYAAHGGPAQCQ